MKKVILASASPRRRELLHYILDDFDVAASTCGEECGEASPDGLVSALAKRKAENVFLKYPDAVVIGADTVVSVSGRVLGKPENKAEAREFIKLLRGKTHCVYTGIYIVSAGKSASGVSCTEVTFADMSETEIEAYLSAEDYADKAGAYGIQGAAAKYISGINGCYYNVMGLPVELLYRLLKEFD